MSRSFGPAYYYRRTWQMEIVLVGALVVAAEAARIAVALPILLLSFVLVSTSARSERWRRSVYASLLLAEFVIAADGIMSMRDIDGFVSMMVELILGSLPFMLLNHDRPRSYWLATLTTAVVAVGSITFTTNPGVYVGFIAFMLLLLFNLNAANLHLPDASGQKLTEALPSGYFRQFLYVMPVGLLSAAVIFVVFPRARNFSFVLGNLGMKSSVGYSGAISLSGGGEIEVSEQVAMLVGGDPRYLAMAGGLMHFRGTTLETFDGKKWSSQINEPKTRSERLDIRVARQSERGRTLIITQEPSDNQAVFYPGILVDIPTRSLAMGEVLFHPNGNVVRRSMEARRVEYSVRFIDPSPSPPGIERNLGDIERAAKGLNADSGNAPHAPAAREIDLNLDIPASVRDAEYFQNWRREVGLTETTSLADAVARLGAHFRDDFKGSLDNEFDEDNALEAFLTTERSGHCEYFATATALLLRSYGVPTRIVLGYRGGTYNPLIDQLEVRDGNAHAWVESLIPGYGWTPIDLTPMNPVVPGWASSLRLYGTALSFWFRRYVVDYDSSSQAELASSLKKLAVRDETGPIDWKSDGLRIARIFGGVVVIAGVVLLIMRRRRREFRVAVRIPRYYVRFLALLARKGVHRGTGETYAQLHVRAKATDLDGTLIDTVDRALEADLYAPEGATAETRAVIESRIDAALLGRRSA